MDNYAITVVNFGRGKTSNFPVEPAPTWRRPAVGRHLDMVMTLKSLHLRDNCLQSLESGKMDAAVNT